MLFLAVLSALVPEQPAPGTQPWVGGSDDGCLLLCMYVSEFLNGNVEMGLGEISEFSGTLARSL